ncbi:MAG: hypothetical protein ACQRW7_13400 [Caulobacterales bacterium]|uniref:hypothetical protein n=1 Tax=Glycocaulis sp. TaxID=1969725 RepID=UPI003F9F191B
MLSVLSLIIASQCPSYADLPQPAVGGAALYSRVGGTGPSLGIGERIEQSGRHRTDSLQYIVPPGEEPIPGRRIGSALGGTVILSITPVQGEGSREQRVSRRDLERLAEMEAGEEIRFNQDFAGNGQEVRVRFEGCETFEGEPVSVYRIESPEEQRTVSISHETGWWVRSASAAGEMVRTAREF